MNPPAWHVVTGEYPPEPGGIADYSALVAHELARSGAEVHVWTSGDSGKVAEGSGVVTHRSGGTWSRADLARLGETIDRFAGPRRLLVQYAPNSWGRKGMNLGFARWLVGRSRRGDVIDAMFHEVWYIPGAFEGRVVRRVLPLVQRPMARRVLAASSRVFVSTPRWADLLEPLDTRRNRRIAWLPVPSTIPVVDDPAGVVATRATIARGQPLMVGSFGTFSNDVAGLLEGVLPALLREHPQRVALLIGRNGASFADRLVADHPDLAGRLVATGGLVAEDVSRHLQACDLLIQPYPDGVCGRRTTCMAALAHGKAVVTTSGSFTDPSWQTSDALALVPLENPLEMVRMASNLLEDPSRREQMGQAGRALYQRRFAIERTIEALVGGTQK